MQLTTSRRSQNPLTRSWLAWLSVLSTWNVHKNSINHCKHVFSLRVVRRPVYMPVALWWFAEQGGWCVYGPWFLGGSESPFSPGGSCSPFSPRGSCVLNSPQRVLFSKIWSGEGGDVAPTVSLHCFLFLSGGMSHPQCLCTASCFSLGGCRTHSVSALLLVPSAVEPWNLILLLPAKALLCDG